MHMKLSIPEHSPCRMVSAKKLHWLMRFDWSASIVEVSEVLMLHAKGATMNRWCSRREVARQTLYEADEPNPLPTGI